LVVAQDTRQISRLQLACWHKYVSDGATIHSPLQGSYSQTIHNHRALRWLSPHDLFNSGL